VVSVKIPAALRQLTGGVATVEVDGRTVAEVIDALAQQHPGIEQRLLDGSGEVTRFIYVFVEDEDIRHSGGLGTRVEPGQRISILPAVAGG
jgi:molybdopterin synthase sulfur carrier subunit